MNKIFKICNKYIKLYKICLVIHVFLSIFISSLSIIIPYITGNFIDELIIDGNMNTIYTYCIRIAIISLINIIIGYINSKLYLLLQIRMGLAFNLDVISYIQDLPLSFMDSKNKAFISQNVNQDCNNLIIFCITIIQNTLTNFITIIFTLILLLISDINLTLILMLILSLYFVFYVFYKKHLYKINVDFTNNQSKFFAKLMEQLNYLEFIKNNSIKDLFHKRLNESSNKLIEKAAIHQKGTYIFSSFDKFISSVTQIFIYLFGGIKILAGQFTIGMFTIFSNYFSMLRNAVSYFFNFGNTLQQAMVSYDRIMEIYNTEISKCGIIELNNIEKITVEYLYFSYGNNFVVSNLNLTFQKGKIYGIIGSNGSGKSTFIKLLTGIYLPYSGKIKYNDINIKDINMKKFLRTKCAISEQEPELINDTILYNLIFEERELTSKEAVDLSRLAILLGFKEFIDKNSLDMEINEMNSNTSGGEKQKISLIRSLLKKPDLLILDEPTSALDQQSIKNLVQLLQKIKSEKIILIITHDEEIINACDEIYKF